MFCLVILGIVLFVLERVRSSPFGRVLRAIREDAQVAAFAGKDILKFKVKAFAIGGALAGLAGALYAHYSSYIVPEMYVSLLLRSISSSRSPRAASATTGVPSFWRIRGGVLPQIDALPDRRRPVALRPSSSPRCANFWSVCCCCWCCSCARAA